MMTFKAEKVVIVLRRFYGAPNARGQQQDRIRRLLPLEASRVTYAF